MLSVLRQTERKRVKHQLLETVGNGYVNTNNQLFVTIGDGYVNSNNQLFVTIGNGYVNSKILIIGNNR